MSGFFELAAPAFCRWAEWFSFTPPTLPAAWLEPAGDCCVVARAELAPGKTRWWQFGKKTFS
jgi:hypothetical protein